MIGENPVWNWRGQVIRDAWGALWILAVSSLLAWILCLVWPRAGAVLPKLDLAQFPAEGISEVSLDQTRLLVGREEILILDARSPLFFEMGHLPGAFSVPKKLAGSDLDRRLQDITEIRPRAILVYCSNRECKDSEELARSLDGKGWGPVFVFKGGWEEWSR